MADSIILLFQLYIFQFTADGRCKYRIGFNTKVAIIGQSEMWRK